MEKTHIVSIKPETSQLSFAERLHKEGVCLRRTRITTVQVNVGKLCNQSCVHCHVDAGPDRKEIMSRETMAATKELVEHVGATTVDITGGAPEMNPHFQWFLLQVSGAGRKVIVRSNLTILMEEGYQDLPELFAKLDIELVASLPCYTQANVDRERGASVFARSIQALRRLNAVGYGKEKSHLVLSLVYNPCGPALPGPQEQLESDFKRHLWKEHGIRFNRLLTITNTPIGRFALDLHKHGKYESYCELLAESFNPATLRNVMCKEMVSISSHGHLYDCDFNQALGYAVGNGYPLCLGESLVKDIVPELLGREITVGPHCYACTAGAGSSCQGALQS